MWAPAIPVSFGFNSPSSATTDRRSSSIISGQPRRFRSASSSSSSQRGASDDDEEEIGGLGHAVLNAIQSPSSSTDSPNSKTLASDSDSSDRDRSHSKQGKHSIHQQRRQSHKEERELSGSEVLIALQKAGARRSQRAKSVKKKAVSSGPRGGGAPATETAADYSNVRPLNVKSDWGVRLEELERRLREFMNS